MSGSSPPAAVGSMRRSVLRPINEQNGQIEILAKTNNTRRDELNQVYDEIRSTNLLNKVHFETLDNVPVTNNAEQPFSSTYTIEKNTSQVENKPSRLPVSVVNRRTVGGTRIPPSGKSSVKSTGQSPQRAKNTTPAKITYPAKLMPYDQKRKQQLETKEKFMRDVQNVRERIVSRKFAYIWLRKHFYARPFTGRTHLLPSKIDNFYRARLLRNILLKWHSDAKFARNEWRFNVKADCHYRYVLFTKMWALWKEFMTQHREENKLALVASTYYENRIKWAYFQTWKNEKASLTRNRLKLEQIQKHKELEILREIFKEWNLKYLSSKKLNKMSEIADKHFELVQLSKCYSQWYFKFNTEKEDRRANRLGRQHYKLTLLKKCFNSLKMYAIYRRKKKIQKQKLDEYAESQLVYRVYHTWLHKHQQKQQLNEIQHDVLSFQRRYLLARVFSYWKSERDYRIQLGVKQAKTIKFYEKKLKRKVMLVLRENYLLKKQQLDELAQAERFDVKWTKKIFFDRWIDRFEAKQEVYTMHLSFKARRHYENRLLLGCFKTWVQFIDQERNENLKVKKADDFFRRKITENYLNIIRTYVQITKHKRKNHLLAEEFYIKNTWYKYFNVWSSNYQNAIETQMNVRIAILHHESKVKENVFITWVLKYEEKLKCEINENRAGNWYEKKLIKKLFDEWKESVNENKSKLNKELIAEKHDLRRLCLPVYTRWKTLHDNRRALIEKCLAMEKHYERTVARKILIAWFAQTKQFKLINRQVEEKFRIKRHEKLLEMLQAWHELAQTSQREKANEQLAQTFHLKHLMLKIVNEWRSYSQYRRSKKAHDQQMIDECGAVRANLIAADIFTKWKSRLEKLTTERTKELIAQKYCEKKLLDQVYSTWRAFVKQARREKLQETQAYLFAQIRVKTEVFFRWKMKFEHEMNMREKNMKALMFWCINIQSSYFNAWFTWYKYKRDKKKRYKQAIEQRHFEIYKECGRKFLTYAADSKVRRLNVTRLLKEKYVIQSSELEYKYFHIWLNKTKIRQNKVNPGGLDSNLNSKSTALVRFDFSQEKREKITKVISNPELKIENQTVRSRPAPRKPNFLLDSLDASKINNPIIVKPPNVENTTTTTIMQPYQPIEPTILLPPTAFTLKSPGPAVKWDDDHPESRNSNLAAVSATSLTDNSESNVNPRRSDVNKIAQDLELIEIKKRLENFVIQSEKLKRLKEQEKLLENCIKSNEITKTSICETIFEEKNHVKLEIEQLSNFVKVERKQLNDLVKKHKINL